MSSYKNSVEAANKDNNAKKQKDRNKPADKANSAQLYSKTVAHEHLADPGKLTGTEIMTLQRCIGNRAVCQMLSHAEAKAGGSGMEPGQDYNNGMSTPAGGKPVQFYRATDEGYLLSQNSRLLLRKQKSKELYATQGAIDEAGVQLEQKKVNVELEPGEDLEYEHQAYKKVTPKFTNLPENMKGETQLEQERDESQQRLDQFSGVGHFFKSVANTVSIGYAYSDYFRAQSGEQDKLDTANMQLDQRRKTRNAITAAIPKYTELREMLTAEHIDKVAVKQYIKDNVGAFPLEIYGKILYQCNHAEDDLALRNSLIADIDSKVAQLNEEISEGNKDKPSVPTNCDALKNYLLSRNGDARENESGVGNFYHTTYKDEKNQPGNWPFHYAATVMNDGNDNVTLEDAAGSSVEKTAKTHWFFNMYGTGEGQSFAEKTRAAYDARAPHVNAPYNEK